MILLHNALIVNEGKIFNGYISINGSFISEIGEGLPSSQLFSKADVVRDLNGAYLLPGAIDTHVHFRQPGLTHKGSIESESAAAISGGVTSFLDMPNTKPTTTTLEVLEEKRKIAAETSFANYGFFIGATHDNIDLILSIEPSLIPGVKLFMGSSTGNMLLDDDISLKRLFSSYNGVIAIHAEDEATLAKAKANLIEQYGNDCPVALHHIARPTEACVKATQRAINLAADTDARLHILHISTADELAMLASLSPDLRSRITAETCPQYLYFTFDSLTQSRGYVRKCNPAVKGEDDRQALRNALTTNLIHTIATDHAPHLLSEKQGSLFNAASGMPGIKFMLPLLMDLTLHEVSESSFSICDVARLTAHNPASLYGIERRGYLRQGYYADITIIERTEPHIITDDDTIITDGSETIANCGWTSYAGIETHHRVTATYINGNLAYDGNKVTRTAPLPLTFTHK